jgi:hypothetical protein
MLIKILAACISIALIGFFVSSLMSTSPPKQQQQQQGSTSDAADAVKRQRLPVNNNDSIINTLTATASPSAEVSSASSLQAIISNNPFNDFNDNHLHSSVLPPNTIAAAPQNEHAKKSNNDEIALTKNYVSILCNNIHPDIFYRC